MNRYRNAPTIRGPSKATASTLCQKCLKRGHYSYECSASAQDRPYVSRPSRTQQLQNPKLRPQLTTEVPSDVLHPKGTADAILAKREEERGRKRDLDEPDVPTDPHTSKRARSASSHSVSSVSTISTNRSRSASPRRGSYAASVHDRTRSRSPRPRKRRYSDSSSDMSASSYSSGERTRSRSREWTSERNIRRRHRESSPEERGRARNISRNGSRRARTRSRSVDPSRISRSRISDHRHARGHGERADRDRRAPEPRRERSLSPYSKRLALTQAMNIGR
ncbi:zinc knuckle-domain-containing protein [Aspergillus ambiguus]|uniref:zinc knuckle-domain-containing protein n=1 Tax=Aspergillus ambiguus TaxID=176160 RepID=UPI003CCC91E9